MHKAFALLLITACFSLSGCYKTSEYTETIPAQLELEWEQLFDQSKPRNFRELATIPPEMEQQLAKLGPYRTTATINDTDLHAKVAYKLVFINEIKIDDKHRVMPLLKSIFKDKGFKVIFLSKEEKHVRKESFGIFTHSQTETVMTAKAQVTGTLLIPGQAPTSK
ncbi:MAG: hypothetical protein ACEQSE_08425 [Candidatus Aquirickettsiella gammari]